MISVFGWLSCGASHASHATHPLTYSHSSTPTHTSRPHPVCAVSLSFSHSRGCYRNPTVDSESKLDPVDIDDVNDAHPAEGYNRRASEPAPGTGAEISLTPIDLSRASSISEPAIPVAEPAQKADKRRDSHKKRGSQRSPSFFRSRASTPTLPTDSVQPESDKKVIPSAWIAARAAILPDAKPTKKLAEDKVRFTIVLVHVLEPPFFPRVV